jgi:hypothetical protein
MTEDKSIRNDIASYYQLVGMPGGYSHNLTETLRTIDLYWMSQYKTGNRDSKGFYKYFNNIVHPAADIGSKFTDLDTKNVLLWPELADQEWKIWVMQHRLKQWLKENDFGVFLNQVNDDYPKYGHVFAKKVGKKWKKINIQNVRFNPGSQSFETDDFFHELLTMNRAEILKMKWANKENIKLLLEDGKQIYTIYACHKLNDQGTWDRSFRGRMYRTGGNAPIETTESEYNLKTTYAGSLILHEDKIDNITDYYRELKWEDIPGRRLGMGFVEYLFDNQIAENEAENLERKALTHKATHLWQTRDAGARRNVLTDAENGDILTVDDELKIVPKDNSDLAAFNSTRARWKQNTQEKTFSFDTATGANLPSRTPLGVANISVAMITSYFKKKRENFGMFVSKLLLDDVIPSFQDESTREQLMFLKGSESGMENFLRAWAKDIVAQKAWDWAMGNGGIFPNSEAMKLEEERVMKDLSSRRGQEIKLPERFFADAKFMLDVVTTGEQLDIQNMTSTIQTVLQLVSANPAMLQNKPIRTMFFKLLELAGVNPVDLGMMEEQFQSEPQQMPMQQGGSVTSPSPMGSPMMAPTSQVT